MTQFHFKLLLFHFNCQFATIFVFHLFIDLLYFVFSIHVFVHTHNSWLTLHNGWSKKNTQFHLLSDVSHDCHRYGKSSRIVHEWVSDCRLIRHYEVLEVASSNSQYSSATCLSRSTYDAFSWAIFLGWPQYGGSSLSVANAHEHCFYNSSALLRRESIYTPAWSRRE